MKERQNVYQIAVSLLLLMISLGFFRIIPSQVVEITKYLFIAITVLACAVNGFTFEVTNFDKLFLAYFLSTIISFITSPYSSLALLVSTAQFIIVNLCIIMIPQKYLKEGFINFMKLFEYFIYFCIFYSVFLYLFGTTQYVNGMRLNYIITPLLGQRVMGYVGDYGYSSIFSNINPFGSYIVIALIYVMVRFKPQRIIHWMKLIIICIGLIMANCRAANVGAVIAIICILYLRIQDKRFRYLLLLATISAGFIIVMFKGSSIIDYIFSLDLNGREDIWGALLQSIREYPIFGIGFAGSTKFILLVGAGSSNTYLAVLTETGIVGLVMMAIIIGASLYNSSQLLKDENSRNTAIFCLALTMYFLTLSFAENVMLNVTSRHIIWFIVMRGFACFNYSYKCPEIKYDIWVLESEDGLDIQKHN